MLLRKKNRNRCLYCISSLQRRQAIYPDGLLIGILQSLSEIYLDMSHIIQ